MSHHTQPSLTRPPLFSCRAVREHDTVRLQLVGELDLETAPLLRDEIAAVRETGARSLILDLRRLTFMDSTGLRCILDCDAEARQDGFSIALIQVSPAVQRVFEITNTRALLRFIEH